MVSPVIHDLGQRLGRRLARLSAPLARLPGRYGLAVVRGRSMQPTLHDGDRLLVHHGGRVRPGRIVVVRLPGGRGLAVKRATMRQPEGWWVERDNPREGTDSWLVGAIPEDDVLAVVLLRLWPLSPPWSLSRSRTRAPWRR